MKRIRARAATKPRLLKAMRIREDVVELVKDMSPKLNLSESELFEAGIFLVYKKMYHKLNK